ncbi:hypothetical protein H4R33_005151 [Dimargaris cristalligena]|uniref:Uncharacterized protein n=1 Tax=Dimargaris cristalligena TaxID=215637 RepID=A0A4Q0A4B4_9FUNG|nr:hypothetical protein H4R33_005151 [Dimargaris cristalligena]RKP40242.1 hypothetical protein BJ085DRAFT_39503 [Dimargaris cristalligena]|eukprot:RKP40242.1 hypothetical protein BJ085DRAFT_39503 [Dimargaris cristalligena]
MKFSAIAFATLAAVCTLVQGAALPTTQTLERRQMSGVGPENVYNVQANKILTTDSAMNARIVSDLNTLKLGSQEGTALYSLIKPYSSISNFLTLNLTYGVESQVRSFSWYKAMYIDSVGSGSGDDSGCIGLC